jgi:hypothetical protein
MAAETEHFKGHRVRVTSLLTRTRSCAFCTLSMDKLKTFLANPTTRMLGTMFVTGSCVLFGFTLIVAILSLLSR